MWTDISQFDIPEHQKTASYGSSKENKFTDIGEVCVVNSMFGKARVRINHPRKKRSLIWPLAALAATGMAVIFWLVQDTPKPPEPMRIIVRSVDSEGAIQTSSQQLKGAPPIVNNPPIPAVPVKPQSTSGLNAKAAIVAKPVLVQPSLPLVKSQPAEIVPTTNPSPVKPPATIQPAATQTAVPVMKSEKPVTTPNTEPLPENNTKPLPASNATPPDQTSALPN